MSALLNPPLHDQEQDLLFLFDTDAAPAGSLRVKSFKGIERPSALYWFSIELICHSDNIDPADLIDQSATLTIRHKYLPDRYIHGIISHAYLGGTGHHRTNYSVTLRPSLHRLALGSDCRIFQQQSVPDIVDALLREHLITDYQFDTGETHLKRDYCVQYRENHLQFIERILAEEGFHYYFEMNKEGHRLIICDSIYFNPMLEHAPALPYHARPGTAAKKIYASAMNWREQMVTTDFTQRDYTFLHPNYPLQLQHTTPFPNKSGRYKRYDYPGRYKEDDSGKRFTRNRLEHLRTGASVANGKSNQPHLSAGFKFELTDHDIEARNNTYNLVYVRHRGKQPQSSEEHSNEEPTIYKNRFRVQRADLPYRPKPNPKPRIDGPQIATVVGPEGEEIYCDEWGRVKVQFPWDRYNKRDEGASCWIRVSQLWAGVKWGAMAIPRIGQEVIVSFLEGDPDQPIITGRTYCATTPPPYKLPQHKTRTTIKSNTHKGDGYNELRFEDQAGSEQIYLHGQKDYDIVMENDRREHIQHNRDLKIDNDRTEEITNDSSSKVDRDRSDATGRKHSVTVGEELTVDVGKHYHLHSGKTQFMQADNEMVLESGQSLTIRSSGGFIKIDGSGITIQGQVVNINSGGSPGTGFPVQVTPAKPATLATGGNISEVEAVDVPAAEEGPTPMPATVAASSPPSQSDVLRQAAKEGRSRCPTCSREK